MRESLAASSVVAIFPVARSGSEKTSAAQTGSDDHRWFSDPAHVLLGSDPGLALHTLTGMPERTCYRYTSGERGIPGFALRQLLRGPQGAQWLAAIMDGADAEWWREHERARRVGAAALAATQCP